MSNSVIITALVALPITAIVCFLTGLWAAWRMSKGNSPMPKLPLPRRHVSVAGGDGDEEDKVDIVKPPQVKL